MLIKLLKHDFKAAKLLLPFYIVSTVLSAILLSMIGFGAFPTSNQVISTIGSMLTVLLVFSCIALMVASVVSVILHFGKQTIGAQGPIMFSLPVTSGKFLLSKLICGTSTMFAATSFFYFLIFTFVIASNNIKFQFGKINWNGAVILSVVIIISVLSIIFSLLMLYISIGVSGYISQNRVLGSIAAYLVISFVLPIILAIAVCIISAIAIEIVINYSGFFFNAAARIALIPIIAIIVMTILLLISVIGMFFICRYLYTKKFDLP